ncbi:MAG TPA: hypothetical protein VGI48_09495 [Caldimonas sp.]
MAATSTAADPAPATTLLSGIALAARRAELASRIDEGLKDLVDTLRRMAFIVAASDAHLNLYDGCEISRADMLDAFYLVDEQRLMAEDAVSKAEAFLAQLRELQARADVVNLGALAVEAADRSAA